MTWSNKRYQSLNHYLRENFNDKIIKISLDGGFSCPNRDGKISNKGCIFCSERGSGDFAGNRLKTINEQFCEVKEIMNKKWKKGKYIAYFQAFTNTYDTIENLKKKYDEAINNDDVIGLAIATRPDCLNEEIVELIKSYSEKLLVWVELGFQTMHSATIELINRGYGNEVYEEAVNLLKKHDIKVVTHIIFGLPEETREMMLETVKYVGSFNTWGVKFHLLHLLKHTPMVKLYDEKRLVFMEKDEYINLIVEALTYISSDMVVHRLTGDAPRDLLIGPMWSLKKWEILNEIDSTLEEKDLWQGKYYEN